MEGIIVTKEHVNDVSHLIKGKRTKRRLRQLSPVTVTTATMTSSCSSATGYDRLFSYTTSNSTEQEDEADMANCLILLAQGRTEKQEENQNILRQNYNINKNRQQVDGYNYHEIVTKNGFDSYECKTCNRFFNSFQALGGHRASHKKPKTQKINTVSVELRCGVNSNFKPNRPNKIHECSICGAEFTSGQALGGHMRRHRASTNNNNDNVDNNDVVVVTEFEGVHVKSRNVLELDLNLPAPEDDLRDSTFQFPALVG